MAPTGTSRGSGSSGSNNAFPPGTNINLPLRLLEIPLRREFEPFTGPRVCHVDVPWRVGLAVRDMTAFAPGKPGGGGIAFPLNTFTSARVCASLCEAPRADFIHARRSALIRHHVACFRALWRAKLGGGGTCGSAAAPKFCLVVDAGDQAISACHVGLGSTSSSCFGVLCAINACLGFCFPLKSLRLLLAYNYVEEASSKTPGATVGESAATGLLQFGYETSMTASGALGGGIFLLDPHSLDVTARNRSICRNSDSSMNSGSSSGSGRNSGSGGLPVAVFFPKTDGQTTLTMDQEQQLLDDGAEADAIKLSSKDDIFARLQQLLKGEPGPQGIPGSTEQLLLAGYAAPVDNPGSTKQPASGVHGETKSGGHEDTKAEEIGEAKPGGQEASGEGGQVSADSASTITAETLKEVGHLVWQLQSFGGKLVEIQRRKGGAAIVRFMDRLRKDPSTSRGVFITAMSSIGPATVVVYDPALGCSLSQLEALAKECDMELGLDTSVNVDGMRIWKATGAEFLLVLGKPFSGKSTHIRRLVDRDPQHKGAVYVGKLLREIAAGIEVCGVSAEDAGRLKRIMEQGQTRDTEDNLVSRLIMPKLLEVAASLTQLNVIMVDTTVDAGVEGTDEREVLAEEVEEGEPVQVYIDGCPRSVMQLKFFLEHAPALGIRQVLHIHIPDDVRHERARNARTDRDIAAEATLTARDAMDETNNILDECRKNIRVDTVRA